MELVRRNDEANEMIPHQFLFDFVALLEPVADGIREDV